MSSELEIFGLRGELDIANKQLRDVWPPRAKSPDEAVNGQAIFVNVAQDGGSAGTSSVRCSYTYTVRDVITGAVIVTAQGLAGNGQRLVKCAMVAGSIGMGYYNRARVFILVWVNETADQTNCS